MIQFTKRNSLILLLFISNFSFAITNYPNEKIDQIINELLLETEAIIAKYHTINKATYYEISFIKKQLEHSKTLNNKSHY